VKVVLFDPLSGGHHTEYAIYLARYLIACGDQVSFVTWSEDRMAKATYLDREPSLDVVYVGGKRPFGGGTARRSVHFYSGFRRCLEFARRAKADVVHHLYLDTGELPTFAATLSRNHPFQIFGTLFWLHFVVPDEGRVSLQRRSYYRARRWAIGRQLGSGRLARLFVHSDATKDALARIYGEPLVKASVSVVPDPAPEPPAISAAQARKELDLPPGIPLMLFFGGLRHNKGPDLFVEALSSVSGEWIAMIAGEPQDLGVEDITKIGGPLIERGKLITRFGSVWGEEVDKYFAAADLVVLPYRRTFLGTSNVLMRAAAATTPVIATDVGRVGATVRNHQLGTVVEPESPQVLADAINGFLADRDRITREVRPHAEQYAAENSWRVLGHEVRESYVSELEEES
jgi:glycosyltransferase involved in cell wall biosynthesis